MNRPLTPEQIEVVDERVAAILRKKTPAERAEMMGGMHRLAKGLIRGRLVSDHPDWSDAQLDAEVARRLLRGAD